MENIFFFFFLHIDSVTALIDMLKKWIKRLKIKKNVNAFTNTNWLTNILLYRLRVFYPGRPCISSSREKFLGCTKKPRILLSSTLLLYNQCPFLSPPASTCKNINRITMYTCNSSNNSWRIDRIALYAYWPYSQGMKLTRVQIFFFVFFCFFPQNNIK